jgi:hypothetical protein
MICGSSELHAQEGIDGWDHGPDGKPAGKEMIDSEMAYPV